MPSPFPGMDPYLEHSEIWPGFHHRLANEIADQLNPLIGPKYYADVEVRTTIEEIALAIPQTIRPDTGVFERVPPLAALPPANATMVLAAAPVRRLIRVPAETKLRAVHVYATEFGNLVTSIELLSPFNKRPGEGLGRYRSKRRRLLQSPVHLIEIDLLRGGQRPGSEVIDPPLDTDYILLVNRNQDSALRTSEIWPVALNEPLPLLPVPLLEPDPDVILDLHAAIQHLYDRAGYGWRIDYRRPVPQPTLRPAMATWFSERLPADGSPPLG